MIISEVIDREELMIRLDDDIELLQELIELFIEDSPDLLQSIKKAVEEKNAEDLQHYAHTLKGAVGNFCAKSALEVAFVMEKRGIEADFSGAEIDYERLVEEMTLVEKALQSLSEEYV